MTQRQLAERLHVDQGTVSRWERSVEQPRPARQAELHALSVSDEYGRSMLRARSFVENDYLPSILLDSRLRISKMSASAQRFYRDRGESPQNMLGMSLEWDVRRKQNSFFMEKIEESGLLRGDCILLRFVANSKGRAHATVYEPIFGGGALIGILCYITFFFELPKIEGVSIALIEAISPLKSDKAEILYRGPHADEALRALSLGMLGRSDCYPRGASTKQR